MNGFFRVIGAVFIAVLFLFTRLPWAEAKADYAIVITIDGLRPDAISKSDVPNIKSLLNNGSYSLEAQTVLPSKTIPAHTSLVTGLTPERHGKTLNLWARNVMDYVGVDTIFKIAKEHGLKSAMFVGKDELEYVAKPGSVDHFESTSRAPTSIEDITSRFSSYFEKEKPELVFIHFPEPDLTGHSKGWLSEDYIKALEGVDRAVGRVLESLRKVGVYKNAFIVITADHGGHGYGHGSSSPEDMTIPWIAFGKGVKRGYKIKKDVFIYDTAPTILFTLGIKPPKTWDGKSVEEIFGTGPN
jgi:Uncharacterized proteins of the AP superfamily